MIKRVVQIEGSGRRIAIRRGFLSVSDADSELGKVPVEDIAALIFSTPSASITSQAIARLADQGTAVVFCGPNYRPTAYLTAVDGHHQQGERILAQSSAKLPLQKRLWKAIVKSKILAQGDALQRAGVDPSQLRLIASRVRSGDPDNLEGRAAQIYFPLLFGKGFARRRADDPRNVFLNYGYTILRSAMARAIVVSGLCPSLCIKHKSSGSGLRLADDLMEPFRPAVDLIVLDLYRCENLNDQQQCKSALASIISADLAFEDGALPIWNAMYRLSSSLADVYSGSRRALVMPRSFIPQNDTEE